MTFGELPLGAAFRFRPNAPLYRKVGRVTARQMNLNIPTTVAAHSEVIPLTDQAEGGTV